MKRAPVMRLLGIFLFFAISVNANNTQDSLKSILSKQHGHEKIDTYIKLHDESYIAHPYEAVGYIKEAIKEAELIGDKGMEGSLYNRIGNIYFNLGLKLLALDSYFVSLKYGQEVNDKGSIAYCYNDIANVYFDLGKNKIPAEYYLKSVKLFKEENNTLGLAVAYNNLGLVSLREGHYDKALDYFFQSYNLREKEGQIGLMAHSNQFIADAYLLNGHFLKSIEHMQKSYQLYGQINEERSQAKTLALLGNAYFFHEDHQKAIQIYRRALKIFKKFKDYVWETNISLNLGEACLEMDSLNLALDYGNETVGLASQFNLHEQKRDGLKLLADISHRMGHLEKALDYLKRYDIEKDSIWEISNNEKFTRLHFNIASYKEKCEKEVLEVQVRRKVLQRNYMILIFVLGVIVLMVFLSRLRLKRKHERLIFIQNEEIAKLEMAKKEQENLRLNRELEFRNKELTSKTMSIVKSGEFISDIAKELETINIGKENKKSVDRVIDRLKHNIKEDSWKEFDVRFAKVHKDFYTKLNKLYPHLTPNEKKLCAFLRLNMTTKEISAITYQSAKSIDVARSRLRKKLNLSREENLINFLCKF